MFRTRMQPNKGWSDKEPDKESDSQRDMVYRYPTRVGPRSNRGKECVLIFETEGFESILVPG